MGIQLSKKGNKSKFYVLSITKSSRNLMEAQASQCFQSRESSNPFFPTMVLLTNTGKNHASVF